MKLRKIISGGQTGVDRAALDAALELGIPCGGWCPKGRRAEDGVIPAKYPVQENDSPKYPPRTALNVRDSDGTLIITYGSPDRGTALTLSLAKRYKKPHLVIDLAPAGAPGRKPDVATARKNQRRPARLQAIRKWLEAENIEVLNVAGPRASSQPGLHAAANRLLHRLLCSSEAVRRRRVLDDP